MKKMKINGQDIEYRITSGQEIITVNIAGENFKFSHDDLSKLPIYNYGRKNHIWSGGEYYELEELSLSSSDQLSAGSLNSPMPGKVFKRLKNQGDSVNSGETIMILEAMKMEHPIKSPIDGVITEIRFNEGDIVSGGVELAIVEAHS